MVLGHAGEQVFATAIFVVVALAGAVVVGVIASWLRVPYVLAMLLASLPLRAPQTEASYSAIIVVLLVPALVFEAAWNTTLASLRENWRPIAVLVAAGVPASAFAVAFGLAATHELPFEIALIVGAVLSATDPVAVVAIFRESKVPERLAGIVDAESLLNDGLAVVIYSVAIGVALGTKTTGFTDMGSNAVEVLKVIAIGGAIGLAISGVLGALVSGRHTSVELQVVATVVAAFGAFIAAEHVHASGIFASVVAGLSLRAFKRFPTDEAVTFVTDRFWGVLAFIANALVFILLGLRVDVPHMFRDPELVIVTLALVVASRAAVVYLLLPLTGIATRVGNRNWLHVIAFAGMRGALSLALALAVPPGVAQRDEIVEAVAGVVLITLVVQGFSIGPLLRRLQL